MIRGMIDGYAPLGEIRKSSKEKEMAGQGTGGNREADTRVDPAAGCLPRLFQVCGNWGGREVEHGFKMHDNMITYVERGLSLTLGPI